MTAQHPAARLTVPGICHRLPVEPRPDGGSYDVTFLNGHPQIVLPLGVTETGQEVSLIITDLQYLNELVYAALLDQGRLANAAEVAA